MSSPPTVGVVVLNWNGITDTRACLTSLASCAYAQLRVYVVDNGSDDDEAGQLAVEFPTVAVMPQRANLGYTGGCNTGMRRALADGCTYILLLNNDTVVPPDFLGPLVAFATATPHAGAVGPVMLYEDGVSVWSAGGRVSVLSGFTHLEGKGSAAAAYRDHGPFVTEFVAGACLLVSAAVIADVGLLDDGYFAYYEDLDWCYRMIRAGYRCFTVPASTICHRKSASTGVAGTNKMAPVAAYFMARNAFRFCDAQLRGWRAGVFRAAQLLIRAPYNLLFRSAPRARRAYLLGVCDGLLRSTRFSPVP